jgi:hypothetical protein
MSNLTFAAWRALNFVPYPSTICAVTSVCKQSLRRQSNPTTGLHHMLYSGARKYAVHWGWLVRNPGPGISPVWPRIDNVDSGIVR